MVILQVERWRCAGRARRRAVRAHGRCGESLWRRPRIPCYGIDTITLGFAPIGCQAPVRRSRMTRMKRKLILDVDTGTDDAVAIMLAALHPDLELVACTTVNGNREIEHTTDNTLRTLDHIGRGNVPVHAGLSRPIARLDFPIPRAEHDPGVHFVEMPLPRARSKAQAPDAVEYLIETYRNATDEITLVPVGPLSNIAAAL